MTTQSASRDTLAITPKPGMDGTILMGHAHLLETLLDLGLLGCLHAELEVPDVGREGVLGTVQGLCYLRFQQVSLEAVIALS